MLKHKINILVVLFLSLIFSACTLPKEEISQDLSVEYPLHFVGVIPGANCSNQIQVDLFENKTFFLRENCSKNDIESKSSDDIGRWYVDNENRVVLNGTKRASRYFQIINSITIELMDLKGLKIDSTLNYQLKESKEAKSLEPKLALMGMYSSMADSAILYECSTGLRFPVALEADNIALQKAYLASQVTTEQALKTHINAKVSQRKPINGVGIQSVVIVEEFISLTPKEMCQNPFSTAKLKNTYWKLTRLYSKPVPISKSLREAHIILKNDGKIQGFSGCNTMGGNYELQEKKISLKGGLMMSRMFCKDSVESSFVKVLKDMDHYEIKGEYLELYDKKSAVLARFESVYL